MKGRTRALKQCPRCWKMFPINCREGTKEYERRMYCSRSCARHFSGGRRPSGNSLQDRFWEKVEKTPGGCWVWQGAKRGKGYGDIYVGDGRRMATHQLSYQWAHGTIPDGMFVLHRCDNKLCVNPDHLFTGTHQDNMDDLKEKTRLGIRPHFLKVRKNAKRAA